MHLLSNHFGHFGRLSTPHNPDGFQTPSRSGDFAMFERYFCPRVVARLRASPDVDWLASFLDVLHSRGHARLCVQFYLREAELFGLWLRKRRRPLTCVTDDDIRVFASRPPLRSLRCTAYSAGRHLIRHLRHRRLVLPPPALFSARIERVVADYDAHLCNVAGLAAATRLYCRRYAREFLHSVFGTGPIRWSHLRGDHVRSFVAGYGQTGRTASARVAGGSIRC